MTTNSLDKAIEEARAPGEIRQRAGHWYDRQIEIIAKSHGPSWPAHRDWIDDYLQAEIRQRLWDLGWRPKA